MKSRIDRIGRSSFIRIPKRLLARSGLSGEVDITAEKDRVVIRSTKGPRTGWAAAFKAMAEAGDDAPILGDDSGLTREWDEKEWEWR